MENDFDVIEDMIKSFVITISVIGILGSLIVIVSGLIEPHRQLQQVQNEFNSIEQEYEDAKVQNETAIEKEYEAAEVQNKQFIEIEKPVVVDITGVGVVAIGIGIILSIILLYIGICKYVQFSKEKLKKYEEIMTKPLDTFGDSSFIELQNKYNQ